MSANRLVQDVIRLLSTVVRVRFERSEPIDTSVEEITPVLYDLAYQYICLFPFIDAANRGASSLYILIAKQKSTDAR